MFSGLLYDLSVEVLGDLLSKLYSYPFVISGKLGILPLRAHFLELRAKLKDMPFIYQDLTADVLTNFVEISIDTLDLSTLRIRPLERGQITTEERIRTRHRALFLGNAGIGKTTFFRHIALANFSKGTKSNFVPDEEAVPFYVPLKAVDNTAPSPILTYLLRSYRYLAGPRGLRRLIRLSGRHHILLLLDGYDEIFLPAEGQRNYIKEELNLLFSGRLSALPSWVSEELASVYENLSTCRIWLSSRKEFYQQQPLDLDEERYRRSGTLDFVAVTLRGLNNRAALIKSIFDLYRNRRDSYREILNEEALLHDIDGSGDEALIDLSLNPLFLTMMCYIYVQSVKPHPKPNQARVRWPSRSMSELIEACIDLLLEDIDEDKVRSLDKVQHDAFRKRRLLYTKEKRNFLPYFACRLLISGLPVFHEEDLVREAITFFSTEYREGLADDILRGLGAKYRSGHSFQRQLLNQGVFLIVERANTGAIYDFPHRRFREVLAARYLDTPTKLADVINNLRNPNYSEFIYVFFAMSHFQEPLLQEILRRADSSAEWQFYGQLAFNCLCRKPDYFDASSILTGFLTKKIEQGKPFLLPRGIVAFISSEPFARWIEQRFKQSLESGDEQTMAMTGPILRDIDPAAMEAVIKLSNKLPWTCGEAAVVVFLRLAGEVNPALVVGYCEDSRKDSTIFRLWCFVCSELKKIDFATIFPYFQRFSWRERALFLAYAQRYESGIIPSLERSHKPSEDVEILLAFLRFHYVSSESQRKNSIQKPRVFVVTTNMLNKISDKASREKLRPLIGKVFLDRTFVDQSFSPELREWLISSASYRIEEFLTVGEAVEIASSEVVVPRYYY